MSKLSGFKTDPGVWLLQPVISLFKPETRTDALNLVA